MKNRNKKAALVESVLWKDTYVFPSKKKVRGTFTLTNGVVTSDPIKFNASQKTIDRWWLQLAGENALIQKRRAKRK